MYVNLTTVEVFVEWKYAQIPELSYWMIPATKFSGLVVTNSLFPAFGVEYHSF